MSYIGKSKLILRYLGFLKTEYGMQFLFQTFDEFYGFHGPVDTYSFYNDYGCFTLHNVVQRGEWNWYVSNSFSESQYELLLTKIDPNWYISTECYLYRTVLKRLSYSIRRQIKGSSMFFGIKVIKV